MANTLRIKRRTSGATGAPSSLANAELAFNEMDNTLYYGKGDNGSGTATSIIAIAGDGTFATKAYVTSAVSGATPTGVAYLAQSNSWSAGYTNTFAGTVNFTGAIQIDGSAVNTSAAELNVLDGVSAGVATAGKALVVAGGTKNILGIGVMGARGLDISAVTDDGSSTVISIIDSSLNTTMLISDQGDITCGSLATNSAVDVGGDLTVTGNLIVNGTTTTVNSTVVTVTDPIFTVGGGQPPTVDDNKDRGVAFRWHTGAAAKIGFFGYDDSASVFTFIPDATITSEVISGTAGAVVFGDATLAAVTATTVNKVTITAPATGSTLTIANGKTLTASNTLTFTGTDSSSVAFGAGGTVAYTSNTLAVFAATTSAQLAGVISDETGSGALVFANTPTLVSPILGTPTSGTLTNCTGLPISTGVSGLGTGVATFLATPSSANLASAVTDETGSGSLVFATSPTLTTPTLGVASATSINKVAITAPATSATLTIADGKTLTASNTLTFSGTDSSSVAFGAGGTVAYLGTGNAFTGANTFTNATGQTFRQAATQDGIILQGRAGGTSSYAVTFTTATLSASRTLTLPDETGTVLTSASKLSAHAATTSAELAGVISDETGSGALVFANTPTLVTPVLGTPTSGTLTNCTGLPISTGVSGLGSGVATFLATPSSANLLAAVTDETGTGALVFANTPTLVTPILGTPTSGTLTNCTGLPVSTGISGLGTGVATFLATPSSANLASAVTDETGSGALVFGTSPTITTSIVAGSATLAVFNTTAATVTAYGAATSMTFGYSGTAASTTNICTGATATATTNTINIGTGGAAGSTTNVNLGSTSGGTVTVNKDLVVSGNLTINGTTTTVNSTTVTIDDPIFTLGGDTAPAADDNKDRGIEFRWHNGSAAKVGFFGYDDSASVFTFIPDATNSSEVFSGTAGDVAFGKVNNVTITTPASAATLTLGSGKTVTISNTLTFTGTDSSNVNFGTGGSVAYAGLALNQFGSTTSAQLAGVISDETGSGALVFANTPTLVTPILGTPTSGTLTNCTGLPISTGVSGLGSGIATFLATPSSANLLAAVTDETGTGALVFANTPTLVTPILGTPTSGTLTNCTGLPVSTGISGLGSGVATFLATPSSANLLAAVTDETGTGALVFANTPTLVTPVLGAATATSINKVAITAPATSATLTIANSKTLTVSNTLTFTGTDSSSVAFGAGGTVVYESTVCTAIANCTIDGGTF